MILCVSVMFLSFEMFLSLDFEFPSEVKKEYFVALSVLYSEDLVKNYHMSRLAFS